VSLEKTVITKHVVTVWDERCEISVYQKSKSVWIAVGEYKGRRIEETGRSAATAAGHWRKAATYRGNVGL
jgi:hypothetical protein